jgi:branched-subunit amino acid permease
MSYKSFRISGRVGAWFGLLITSTMKVAIGPYASLPRLHTRVDEHYLETCTFDFV